MPDWIRALLARPDEPVTKLSRYTQACGALYLVMGLGLFALPRFGDLLLDDPLTGREPGLLRMVGVSIAIIGWFYIFGGRTNRDSFGLATVVDRLVLPLFLVPVALWGGLELALVLPLAVLDPLLGTGALLLWYRTRARSSP